jgi:predicted ArsR family transcriptional regulator
VPLIPAPVTGGSRGRVLAALRESGVPLPVPALCARTGLSATAVRFHLEHLAEAGAVQVRRDPDHHSPGRPALLYTALPSEAVDPAAAYRVLAGVLAGELPRSKRARVAVAAGRAWAARLPVPSELDNPVTTLMSLFARTGFDPALAADGRTIELRRCPFMALAAQQPEVICSVHLGLARGVLDAVGVRTRVHLVPVLDAPGPCLVHLGSATQRRSSRSDQIATIQEQFS